MKKIKTAFIFSVFFMLVAALASCGHTHTFATDWTSDATSHWHKATCEHTSEVSDKALHTFGEWKEIKASTETEAGVMERKCTVCNFVQQKGIDKKEHVHTFETGWTSDLNNHWHKATCEHTAEVTGLEPHTNTEVVHTVTCTENGTITYTCSICGQIHTITTDLATGHDFNEIETEKTAVEGDDCKLQIVSKGTCAKCKQEITLATDLVEIHTYVAQVTQQATCMSTGKKTYTCTHGDATYTDEILINPNNHTWDEGQLDSVTGITTYTCAECGRTKTSFDAKDKVEATIPAAAIATSQELALKNATLAFDEGAKQTITKAETTISAAIVEKTSITADADTLEKIGDQPIYDFTCSCGGENVSSFNGNVKITVPYTLSEGEDPDNIAIWYINDSGEVTSIKATYNNGFVSFSTNHFSKYALIRLTIQEACDLYGHNYNLFKRSVSTCKEYGQEYYVCQRCGKVEIKTLPLVEHEFELKEYVEATSTSEGLAKYECKHCGEIYTTILDKLPAEDNILSIIFNSLYDGFVFDMEEEVNNAKSNAKLQYYVDEEGKIYTIMTSEMSDGDSFTQIIDVLNKEAYQFSGNDMSKITIPVDILQYKTFLNKVLRMLPSELTNKAIKILANTLFVVDKTDNEITLTITKDSLLELIDLFETKNFGEIIDTVIGEGTVEKITTFVEQTLDSTVAELLTKIVEHGYTIDTLYSMAKEASTMMNFKLPITKEELLAKIIELSDTKIIDLVNSFLPAGQGFTIDSVKLALNHYLGLKLSDLLDMAKGMLPMPSQTDTPVLPDSTDTQELPDSSETPVLTDSGETQELPDSGETEEGNNYFDLIKMIIEAIDPSLELKLGTDYKLSSLKFNLDFTNLGEAIPFEGKIGKISGEASFGQAEPVIDFKDTIAEVKEMLAKFEIDFENIASVINEYVDRENKNNLTYQVYSVKDDETVYKSSLFVVNLENGGRANGYYLVTVPIDDYIYLSYSDTIWKKHVNIKIELNIDYDGVILHKEVNNPKTLIYENDKLSLNETDNVIFNQVMSQEEFDIFMESDPNIYINEYSSNESYVDPITLYFRQTPGRMVTKVTYDKSLYDDSFDVVSDTINFANPIPFSGLTDKTLSINGYQFKGKEQNVIKEIRIQKIIYGGKVYNMVYFEEYKCSWFTNGLFTGTTSGYYDYIPITSLFSENETTKTYGSFVISIVKTEALSDCEKLVTYSISTDGGATAIEYECLLVSHNELVETEREIDACHRYIEKVCSVCNKVTERSIRESHSYERIVIKKGTIASPEIACYECKNCEDKYYNVNYCEHESLGSNNVCNYCHNKIPAEFVDEYGNLAPVVFEVLDSSTSETIHIGINVINHYVEYSEADAFNKLYKGRLLIANLEDGNIVKESLRPFGKTYQAIKSNIDLEDDIDACFTEIVISKEDIDEMELEENQVILFGVIPNSGTAAWYITLE